MNVRRYEGATSILRCQRAFFALRIPERIFVVLPIDGIRIAR